MLFQGVDLGDLFRPESPLSFRRLLALVRALPHDSALQAELREAAENAPPEQASQDLIRQRKAEFERRNAAARQAEGGPHDD